MFGFKILFRNNAKIEIVNIIKFLFKIMIYFINYSYEKWAQSPNFFFIWF